MSPRDVQLTWLDAWQEPPPWQELARLDGCTVVVAEPVAEAPYPVAYDSLGILFGAGVVGLVALREMGKRLRQVSAIHAEDVPLVVEVAPDVARSRSGIEAKDDVEAHTAHGKKARTG